MFEDLVKKKAVPKAKETQHVVFVLDTSGSMTWLGRGSEELKDHFNEMLRTVKAESKTNGIPTRISLITFNSSISERFKGVDVDDVNEMKLSPHCNGGTALIDAIRHGVRSLELNEGEGGLVYVITDGGENTSRIRSTGFISSCDEFTTITVACPPRQKSTLAHWGIPDGNIVEWELSKKGIDRQTEVSVGSTRSYYATRSTGVKKVSNFFELDVRNLDQRKVRRQLTNVQRRGAKAWTVPKESGIQEFVESKNKYYRPGSCYYEITKREKVQEGKELLLMRKGGTGIFRGKNLREIKDLLGMPEGDSTVNPIDLERWRVLVQSTSNNRKLVRGTKLVLL